MIRRGAAVAVLLAAGLVLPAALAGCGPPGGRASAGPTVQGADAGTGTGAVKAVPGAGRASRPSSTASRPGTRSSS